jgi:hypothetical protein
MKTSLFLFSLMIFSLLFVTGCDFIAGVFQTGVGVGIFIAVVILILIFFIGRIGRRRGT